MQHDHHMIAFYSHKFNIIIKPSHLPYTGMYYQATQGEYDLDDYIGYGPSASEAVHDLKMEDLI